MKIPSSFENAIAKTFYDKEFILYSTSEVVDDEGWGAVDATATSETFLGNIQFSNLGQVQETYGLQEEIDATVTTDEEIEIGQVFGYDGHLYKVFTSIPNDSHNLLIVQKWESKSSTSISA